MKVENIKAAIEILEALNELLKPKDPTNFPNLNKFKNLVISQLTECYHVLSLYYWWIDRNIELSKEAAEKALMLDPNRWGLHQNLSVISYLQGDRNAAEFHTLRAKRLNPQSDLPHLNEAFFAAADKKNQRLLQILKNRVRHVSDTIMTDVVSFIHDQYEKDADNYTLLFYLGWINTTFVDKSLGNEQLLEFVNQCKADTNYADLITEAKKLVSK